MRNASARGSVGLASLAFVACTSPARGPAPSPASTSTRIAESDAGVAGVAVARGTGGGGKSAFRDLVMTREDCLTPPHAHIARADALDDLLTVERIVRRGWAGFETRVNDGVDFDGIFAALAKWVREAPEPISVEELQKRLVLELRPAADNHLAFLWLTPKGHARRMPVGGHENAYTANFTVLASADASGSREALLTSNADGSPLAPGSAPTHARFVECEGHPASELFRPTVIETGDVLTVAALPVVLAEKQPAPLFCRFRFADGIVHPLVLPMRRLRAAPRGGTGASRPAFELRAGPIPVVTLRTMWGGKNTELVAFVASAPELRDSKAVVLDLRGNGGGADGYGRDWLAALTNQRLEESEVDRLDSDVTRQGIMNDNTCELAEGLDDATAIREANGRLAWGSRLVTSAENGGRPLREWQHRPPQEIIGRAPALFHAPLVMLSDSGCASACESFLTRARQIESAVVVGENSGGIGVFSEVLTYRLPRSGLGMTAGMKHYYERDAARSVLEGRGHLPDYWLDSDDPLKLTERIAECLAKPACSLRARRPKP